MGTMNQGTALATPDRASLAARSCMRALEAIGWQLIAADVDMARGTARVELRHADHMVTLDADSIGRATVTREIVERAVVTVGRRGDRMPVERVRVRFVARTRHEGPRQAMRWLANYVQDNSTGAQFSARRAFALLMAPVSS